MKKNPKKLSVALTIAGSDSGGGAGIQADLKTFAALGIHGTSAITCLTAQNPRHVLEVEPCSTSLLRKQLEALFSELPPAAAKTGMLFSRKHIELITRFWRGLKSPPPLVVDPVMISTSGSRLLAEEAISILKEKLLPLATLATPNLAEASVLVGSEVKSLEQMRAAARAMQARFGCAILLKGGHLKNAREAVDIFYDGKNELLLSAPFIKGIRTHGTGCTYSAAICAALAHGHGLAKAVEMGKQYITSAISQSYLAGRHFVLGTASANS